VDGLEIDRQDHMRAPIWDTPVFDDNLDLVGPQLFERIRELPRSILRVRHQPYLWEDTCSVASGAAHLFREEGSSEGQISTGQ
jgi:hypothetical protein